MAILEAIHNDKAETPMKTFEIVLAIIVLMCGPAVAAELEERAVQADGERISLSVPKEWPAIEGHRTPAGKSYFQLGPADTNFSFQVYLNEALPRGTNAEKRLERSLEASLKPLAEKSVEGKVELVRFGSEKEGVYARITDRAQKLGEYLYYTRGFRLIGINVLGFELVSNDKDFLALSNTLAVIESAKIAGAKDKK